MIGPEGVVDLVLARLRDAMPAKLAQLRERYGDTVGDLPDVTRFLAREPENVAIDKPPMICVVEQDSSSTTGPRRQPNDTGGTTYVWRYRVSAFVWAVGGSYDETSRRRKRYGLAVRELLLEQLGLGADQECVLDPAAMFEEYSDVAVNGPTRQSVAGMVLNLQYDTQEVLARTQIPVAVPPANIGLGQP